MGSRDTVFEREWQRLLVAIFALLLNALTCNALLTALAPPGSPEPSMDTVRDSDDSDDDDAPIVGRKVGASVWVLVDLPSLDTAVLPVARPRGVLTGGTRTFGGRLAGLVGAPSVLSTPLRC